MFMCRRTVLRIDINHVGNCWSIVTPAGHNPVGRVVIGSFSLIKCSSKTIKNEGKKTRTIIFNTEQIVNNKARLTTKRQLVTSRHRDAMWEGRDDVGLRPVWASPPNSNTERKNRQCSWRAERGTKERFKYGRNYSRFSLLFLLYLKMSLFCETRGFSVNWELADRLRPSLEQQPFWFCCCIEPLAFVWLKMGGKSANSLISVLSLHFDAKSLCSSGCTYCEVFFI